MTLPASGPINFDEMNLELGLLRFAQISLNDPAVRTLFEVSSGAISVVAAYGKSNPPPIFTTYTARTSPQTQYVVKNAFDNVTGRLISVGANDLYYTTDGINWTQGTYASTFNQSRFCNRLSDGYFYTGHSTGILRYSQTGIDNYVDWAAPFNNQPVSDIIMSGSNYVLSCGVIWTATTRGGTWTSRSNFAVESFARNPNTGRLVGVRGNGLAGIIVSTSDDDGVSWTQQQTYTPSGANASSSNQFITVHWFNAADGFIIVQGWFNGTAGRGEVWKLNGLGTAATNPLASVPDYLISFGNGATYGYVCGFGGRIYRSTDGGDNWVQQTSNTSASLGAVTHMPNISRLVATGYQTTSYVTANQTAPTTAPTVIGYQGSYGADSSIITVSPSLVSTTQAGDICVVVIMTHSTGTGNYTFTPPAGWVELLDQGLRPNLWVGYKSLEQADIGATRVWTASEVVEGGVSSQWVIIRNAAFRAIGPLSTATGTGPVTAASVNNAVNLSLNIAFFHGNGVPTPNTLTTTLSGWTLGRRTNNGDGGESVSFYKTGNAGANPAAAITFPSGTFGTLAAIQLSFSPIQ
jgi:hypothetical protein